MNIPYKYIALLVITSLVAIFVYQAYWLVSLYHSQKREMEQKISDAMGISNYGEVGLRIKEMRADTAGMHGEIGISAGYVNKSSAVSTNIDVKSGEGDNKIISKRTIVMHHPSSAINASLNMKSGKNNTVIEGETEVTFDTAGQERKADKAGEEVKNQQEDMFESADMARFTQILQQGLHTALDQLKPINFDAYDSLLHKNLLKWGIDVPYRLDRVLLKMKNDSVVASIDTLETRTRGGYVETEDAQTFCYAYDAKDYYEYRLQTGALSVVVLRQMTGILATSLFIIVVLAVAFWYLILIIRRQKTMEEMTADFTNNMTHELKTPIAVAYSANDALLNFHGVEDTEKRDRYLRICREQLLRLSGLVEQILSMSMKRRKSFRLNREEIAVKPLLDSLAEQHRLKADRPVNISISVEPKDLNIVADRTHIGQMVSNLIDNAVKYSPGQADVRIRARALTAPRQVEISMEDSGIGIAPDKLPFVFDKFYRVADGLRHDVKGYGLGLYYVRTMAEQHDGTVTAASRPGQGSTFTITI